MQWRPGRWVIARRLWLRMSFRIHDAASSKLWIGQQASAASVHCDSGRSGVIAPETSVGSLHLERPKSSTIAR
jgi:hypothetical protein